MSEISSDTSENSKESSRGFRERVARLLGVEAESKENLYLDLSRGATLFDPVYWLQIFFSAGIATLGLVMDSPAVIIGAMLISPLMGPILAAGLALASGDMVLGLRVVAKIFLSCALAVAFAVFLVAVLPFREMTNEIAARMQPNTLDLFIALFSGAVGSIVVCREVKGIATSIPGVAIAVALMPPLCVAGYGLGLMTTFDTATGWRVASGGGLLFLTNLVAITFMAMIVFLAVQLITPQVKNRIEEFEHRDPESAFILKFIERFPGLEQAREIRSLPVRFAMILIPLVAILIPLSQSFSQLQSEITQERSENTIRNHILDLWQKHFQKKSDGAMRGTIDQLTILEKDGKLTINLRLFDDEPYTLEEKKQYAKLIAERLGRPVESITLNLTEIPTTSTLAAMRERDKQRAAPTIAELQAGLWQKIDAALTTIEFPPEARFLGRRIVSEGTDSLNVKITYLSEVVLAPDVQNSIVEKIRANLDDAATRISLERVPKEIASIEFSANSATIPILGMLQLDFVGREMSENSPLVLVVAVQARLGESTEIVAQRMQAIADYLDTRWQITGDRIKLSDTAAPNGQTKLTFQDGNAQPESETPQEPSIGPSL